MSGFPGLAREVAVVMKVSSNVQTTGVAVYSQHFSGREFGLLRGFVTAV
jgi:hypothetical protein